MSLFLPSSTSTSVSILSPSLSQVAKDLKMGEKKEIGREKKNGEKVKVKIKHGLAETRTRIPRVRVIFSALTN